MMESAPREVPMSSTKRLHTILGILFVAIVGLVSASCGGSSSQGISQAQAQAISHEIATAMADALTQGIPAESAHGAQGTLAAAVTDLQPEQLTGCTVTGSVETCTYPISFTGPCPDGGTVGVSGNLDLTLSSSGSGSDTESFTITPTNCGVGQNLTITGNPSIDVTTEITVASNQIVYPVTLTETGGVTYGPKPSGSCTLNVSYSVTPPNTCTVSGTICGRTLTGGC